MLDTNHPIPMTIKFLPYQRRFNPYPSHHTQKKPCVTIALNVVLTGTLESNTITNINTNHPQSTKKITVKNQKSKNLNKKANKTIEIKNL